MHWLLTLIEAVPGLSQELIFLIVSKVGNQQVQQFFEGAVVGVFPNVYFHVLGCKITLTDRDIRTFLQDLKTKNWQDMLDHAEASLNPAA